MPDRLESIWNDAVAGDMSEPELLLYRSNLLGSDLRITNFGGGNTSGKICEKDPVSGADVDVLWVKGSGGDLRSMKLDGFATLYLEKLRKTRSLYRGLQHEDDMVALLPHCTFNLNPRVASIDTPLHAFIPHTHVDHMHPDAIIAIACAINSEDLTREVFGNRLGWLPWQRPGYDLGLKIGELAQANSDLEGVVLQGHGLFTWANTSKECYLRTLDVIQTGADWLETREIQAISTSGRPPFPPETRRQIAAAIMPSIRGKISETQNKVGAFNDANTVLEFVNSERVEELAALGTSCPDHFLRTKIRPLVLDIDRDAEDLDAVVQSILATLDEKLRAYREEYDAYYERCRRANSPAMRDPNAVVYLLPGIGMLSFAHDKATARIAGEFYINAMNVIRGAETAGGYIGLEEQEAFDIEYWLLEEAKLQRMPTPKALAGKVALVTGAAGGIGEACARRLLQDGACVMLADIDEKGASNIADSLQREFSSDLVRAVACDVTDEASVSAALMEIAVEFGGIDILVSNAGIASSAPLDETSLDLWNRNINILTTGYFLVSREALRIMTLQGRGGSIIFVGSKNALVASPNAAAYCTAKGAELQLARAIAVEGATKGVRCNVVNPDAVLRGSKIWSGNWKKDRAAAYGLQEQELEDHYRKRSLLQRSVYPEDVAEGVAFFASERSSKSTGNILNVDAGHAPSFTR